MGKGWTESSRESHSLRRGSGIGLDQRNRKMKRSPSGYYRNKLDRCCKQRVVRHEHSLNDSLGVIGVGVVGVVIPSGTSSLGFMFLSTGDWRFIMSE